jgi:hypothetical protein
MPLTSEMNDYTNAAAQTQFTAKEVAVNAFLSKYPNSQVGDALLEQLIVVDIRQADMDKVTDAANRMLSRDSKDLRGLYWFTYATKGKAVSASPAQARLLLDDAASAARIGLANPSKSPYLSDLDFKKLRTVTSPISIVRSR